MPPTPGSVAQTPEPKNSGGIAGVFKSLTSGRGSKSTASTPLPPPPTPATALQTAQRLFGDARRGDVYGGPSEAEFLYDKLRTDATVGGRLAAAESLKHAIADYPISGVTAIWYATKKLIDPENSPEERQAGYDLMTACVKHPSSSDMDRREYFDTLTKTVSPEDFHFQLAALIELCKHGKDLSGFHYEVTALLSKWVLFAFGEVEKARKASKPAKPPSKPRPPLREEINFDDLFNFVINVIKFNLFDEEATESLIDGIIRVATKATRHTEITPCVRVMNALVTYGAIPISKLKEFLVILCSVQNMVPEARDEAWNTISNLSKSHNGYLTITILLDVLRNVDAREGKDLVKKTREAIAVLERIVAEKGADGFPLVPLTLLVDALSRALSNIDAKLANDVLRIVSDLFGEKDEPLDQRILDENWHVVFDVAVHAVTEAQRLAAAMPPADIRPGDEGKPTPAETVSIATAHILDGLLRRVEQILSWHPEPKDFTQREDCILFFSNIPTQIHNSCAERVISYYVEYRFCYPSDEEWETHCNFLLNSFFLDRARPTAIRLQALKAVTDVYEVVEVMDEYQASGSKRSLIDGILKGLNDETDVDVVHGMAAFAVSVCDNNDLIEFESIIQRLHDCIDRTRSASNAVANSTRPAPSTLQGTSETLQGSQPESTPATAITRGFIQIFMRAMDRSTAKAQRSFDEILFIARSNTCDTQARLSAMKMLFRLRADWANRIFLTPFTEADALSAVLYRTSQSLARKQAMDDEKRKKEGARAEELRNARNAQAHGTMTRAISGISRTLQLNHQLWMTPDPDALPEPPSNKASTLLVSANAAPVATANTEEEAGKPTVAPKETLKMNIWLETIIDLIQQDCDWEVYSYMLAHLPSQLANHSLFKAATPQIKLLRSVLCDQIKQGSFHEPPLSSGLRKTDVAICLYQVLTMVMSYHRHFSRGEEDEIVKCFIQGVAAESREGAKCCIHALSICCHEFPASMKAVLATLLQKMQMIITQSHVAVHILEFLAGLSRLPELYASFREDDHRTVFGICFRYLESVRAPNPKASRPSSGAGNAVSDRQSPANSGPNPAIADKFDDLPQYVFSLAYHVITYWFLSLRLTDRGKHVSYITKNLVWLDDNKRPRLDEQADVMLDFMRRTAYADVDESRADEDFTPEYHGDILKERWLVGQSIITVEQGTRTGWAQITKRQPSATSHYMVRQKFDAPQPHQVVGPADGKRDPTRVNANFFLPSNLPVQLLASTSDTSRPIRLPDDETISRAIRAMDRISTVDGHKVGIVYIGAGQTLEKDILPNVSGSTDYLLFLAGLGTLTKLHGATFNTQGLDREYDTDGEYTICWRDRVTELVFHVTTMMPTNIEHDPLCTAKKRHIGNDFVNIIFNNSGNPFNFDTFPSEFNFVNIVITPESRASFMATRDRVNLDPDSSYYKVQVMSKQGFPAISPASETKILSLRALPEFIRLVALNASVFCLVWANRQGGEHVSSWRSRLREIERLRQKYGNQTVAASPSPAPANAHQGLGGLGSAAVAEEKPSTSTRNPRDSFQGMSQMRRGSVANFLTNVDKDEAAAVTRGMGEGKREGEGGDRERGVEDEKQRMVDGLDFSNWA